MKLSVVILRWNSWEMIRDCLESIFRETGGISFEVIVTGNVTTDGTVENIRREFAQPNLRILESGDNLGLGAWIRQKVCRMLGKSYVPCA